MALPEELANLVTDRTEEDVERLRELKAKLLAGEATNEERAEYLAGMKGAYNYTDLNRVGTAMQFVADTLTGIAQELQEYRESLEIGDDPIFDVIDTALVAAVDPKTDWTMADIPTSQQMQVYISNILNLVNAITLPIDAPAPPYTASALTWKLANAIEELLIMIYETAQLVSTEQYQLIDGLYEAQVFAGENIAVLGGY